MQHWRMDIPGVPIPLLTSALVMCIVLYTNSIVHVPVQCTCKKPHTFSPRVSSSVEPMLGVVSELWPTCSLPEQQNNN